MSLTVQCQYVVKMTGTTWYLLICSFLGLFGNWNVFYIMQPSPHNKLVLISCEEHAKRTQGKCAVWRSQARELRSHRMAF